MERLENLAFPPKIIHQIYKTPMVAAKNAQRVHQANPVQLAYPVLVDLKALLDYKVKLLVNQEILDRLDCLERLENQVKLLLKNIEL